MTYKRLLILNSIVFIGLGIAFCLYAPLMLAFFQITDIQGIETIAYWFIVSFARLFGAMMLILGLLLWALGSQSNEVSASTHRGIIFAILIGYTITTITILTQQISVWQSTAGWILLAILTAFLVIYGFFLGTGRYQEYNQGPN